MLKLKVNERLVLKASANSGQKRQPNSVSVSVTLKCDDNGSENPNANALFVLATRRRYILEIPGKSEYRQFFLTRKYDL